jgi:hypothetical protein
VCDKMQETKLFSCSLKSVAVNSFTKMQLAWLITVGVGRGQIGNSNLRISQVRKSGRLV